MHRTGLLYPEYFINNITEEVEKSNRLNWLENINNSHKISCNVDGDYREVHGKYLIFEIFDNDRKIAIPIFEKKS